mmetsp:Transcript_12214/g.45442  ORF Transcript_12214/g.45442 Transcript_12214/m.45442 type:complete len:285 (+) Transcript_12214:1730-2584(+)
MNWKRGFVVGSAQNCVDTCPGARGPSNPKSSAIVAHAISSGNGLFAFCSSFSASAASSPIKSLRCERVCPIFTNTGPRLDNASRSATPRVRSWRFGMFSSDLHRRNKVTPTRITVASRRATCPGLLLKNARSFSLLNAPRSESYGSSLVRFFCFVLLDALALFEVLAAVLALLVSAALLPRKPPVATFLDCNKCNNDLPLFFHCAFFSSPLRSSVFVCSKSASSGKRGARKPRALLKKSRTRSRLRFRCGVRVLLEVDVFPCLLKCVSVVCAWKDTAGRSSALS